MKLELDDASFAELRLIEDWAAEHPGKVKLDKIPKEDGQHYHYGIRVTHKKLLYELHERIEKLRHNQQVLANFFSVKAKRPH